LVSEGKFRDDLFYRLNVVKIELPPLSKRREDIPLLIDAFVQKFNLKMGKQITGVSDQVLRLLLKYDYPGNVRELENIIEHAFVLCGGSKIDLDCLPKELTMRQEETDSFVPLKEEHPLEKAEAEIVKRTLEKNRGNRIKAAQELGISRVTLWRKIRRYGLV
jgi:transcriptional regulator with PAS, ATPase and Fis domain